jgi:hypothetical protein
MGKRHWHLQVEVKMLLSRFPKQRIAHIKMAIMLMVRNLALHHDEVKLLLDGALQIICFSYPEQIGDQVRWAASPKSHSKTKTPTMVSLTSSSILTHLFPFTRPSDGGSKGMPP